MILNEFILQAFIFIFAVFFSLYIPGNIFIKKLNLPPIINLTISLILGISLWGIQGYFFGILNIREATYLYILLAILIWLILYLRQIKIPKKIPKYKFKKSDYAIIGILIAGIILQLMSVAWNFIPFNNGLFFNSGLPDNIYHAGVAKELIKNVPPLEPGLYDVSISKYHYLSNLISADFARIFKLNIIFVDFHFFPILLTILFGLGIYSFGKTLNIGNKFIILLLLVMYFIGDLIPYFSLIVIRYLEFSYSTLDNPLSLWYSFSRYTGLVLFFGGLTILTYFFKTRSKIASLVFALILGSIIGFKVYIGLFILFGLMFLGVYYLIEKRYKYTLPLFLTAIISMLIYLPGNKDAGGLIFTGFWRFEDFIAQPKWELTNHELARQIYREHNNFIKVYLYDLTYAFIYIFFSVGFLLIGFFNSRKSLKNFPKELHLFLLSGLLVTSILGFFFIQKTGGANSSQFLISIYIVGSIYTALALNQLKKSTNKLLLGIVIILFLMSSLRVSKTGLDLLNKIYAHSGHIITQDYLDTISYITNDVTGNKVIIFDRNIQSKCLFVNLIETNNLYLCETASPGDKGINDIQDRRDVVDLLLNSNNHKRIIDTLKINNITHVIATDGASFDFLDQIYKNDNFKILEVQY